jgi:hypothetical protein
MCIVRQPAVHVSQCLGDLCSKAGKQPSSTRSVRLLLDEVQQQIQTHVDGVEGKVPLPVSDARCPDAVPAPLLCAKLHDNVSSGGWAHENAQY